MGVGSKVDPDFKYCSDTNEEWMDVTVLREWIDNNAENIGKNLELPIT